uniref:Uncharacterized protein n=1 Tax=Strix occidentalis caurina TaxID=311401 RepID=A0A8D0KTC9_STROC
MAYDDFKKKEGMTELATGRIQREKKRSYKDLLQEEDEIATQVRDSELFPGTEPHKKKRKHSSDEFYLVPSLLAFAFLFSLLLCNCNFTCS